MTDCLFCKILDKKIPSDCVYEDDLVFAFRDINPKAPVHVLIIPKVHIATLNDLDDAVLSAYLLETAKKIAVLEGIAEAGYRTIINCNEAGGQEVYHLHLHVLGGY